MEMFLKVPISTVTRLSTQPIRHNDEANSKKENLFLLCPDPGLSRVRCQYIKSTFCSLTYFVPQRLKDGINAFSSLLEARLDCAHDGTVEEIGSHIQKARGLSGQ
jgi:hypothetical protein